MLTMLTIWFTNLIPRACPVDIKEDTKVDYINGDSLGDNLIYDGINGYELCDDVMGTTKNDPDTVHVLTIIFGLILIILFVIMVYIIIRLIKHMCCSLPEGRVKNSEQEPLLGI